MISSEEHFVSNPPEELINNNDAVTENLEFVDFNSFNLKRNTALLQLKIK